MILAGAVSGDFEPNSKESKTCKVNVIHTLLQRKLEVVSVYPTVTFCTKRIVIPLTPYESLLYCRYISGW
jgi:hypothetical protein